MGSIPAFTSPIDQLVVVGASAGGIDALSVLVKSLPRDLPAPVVIAQHLDPTRPSQLEAILARQSPLPVKTVNDRESLIPGTVYVVPSNRHVSISDHEVVVQAEADGDHRPSPSIDLLLETAAAVFGERLIGVILTGSGSDGAAGAHVVKEAGGTMVIQDPTTAAFPSMPRALSPPLVDAAVPVERMGQLISDMLAGIPGAEATPADGDISSLLDRLRNHRGIDFTAYKTPTIERRLRRRMAAVGVNSLPDYLDYLDQDSNEEQRLVAHFLIKVTRFFRDPPLFTRLREDIMPELAAAATVNGRELRLWSAGCATGEEAYSLALLVAELQSKQSEPFSARIFATDLDDTALSFGRKGLYPASALVDVPEDLVDRFFTKQDGAYEVGKTIRNLIVFGNHDLAQRPPFPHTDLVLCRNVLIYFTHELQHRALDIFAYSLRDGGYLVLGKSESPRAAGLAFAAVDARLRVYRREGPRNLLPPARLPVDIAVKTGQDTVAPRPSGILDPAAREAANKALFAHAADSRAEELLRQLPVGVAVIDRNYDVEMINGVARELLGIHGLAIGQDLVHLAHQAIAKDLRTVIDRIVKENQGHSTGRVDHHDSPTGETRHLLLECRPDRIGANDVVETVVVVIQDVTPVASADKSAQAATSRADSLAEVNRELLAANRELTNSLDTLRAQGDDLRLATAAAQVWAEEIETLNEELQSSNEELETLHEEAQATVEELNVANEELEARAAELNTLAHLHDARRAQLAAVLSAMDDAVIVVDRDGQVVLTNEAYDALLHLLGGALVPANERGIPLAKDETALVRAARGEVFKLDFTAKTADGSRRWFDATGHPLGPEEGGAGVVVIRDITDRSVRRMQEEFLQWAGHELRTPLTALQTYLQLALRQVGADGDERLRAHLSAAVEQTRRQGALIAELLDASRLKTGRLMLHTEPVDLAPLVEHVVEVAQVLAKGQTITVETQDSPIIIIGDTARLEQVLLNLLLNAISYAPDTERIEVTLRRIDNQAEISVRDFGPGINPQQIDRIFEQFSQAEPQSRPGTSGLGLGLYIAREIIREHNGSIAVNSAFGEGATFVIALPLLAEPPDPGTPGPEPASLDET
jgi:two-component system CheB/CheR fusion protein